tara:strand:- start:57 stop:761 length:705 start_codon:yes stop_codon:yes gene_type:complete
MNILEELTIKYDVDALELGYTPLYASLFDGIREEVTKVLEIGVETGRSHRLWLEYFPNATIYGYDIFKYGVEEFHRLQEGNPYLDRSVMFEGDQSNVDDLQRFLSEHGGDFDIIIDDGGHTMNQQQISLSVLWDAVKSEGFYVIEDLHTCSGEWPTLYGYEVVKEGDTLTTDLLYSLEVGDDIITKTNYLSEEVVNNIRESLMSCETKIGVETYISPKGYKYKWPTMIAFMRKK